MEENKMKKSGPAPSELTVDQLRSIAQQLAKENAALKKQIEDQSYYNLFKRLDYLFKTLKYADNFDSQFVTTCRDEIVTLMTPVEIPDEKSSDEAESES